MSATVESVQNIVKKSAAKRPASAVAAAASASVPAVVAPPAPAPAVVAPAAVAVEVAAPEVVAPKPAAKKRNAREAMLLGGKERLPAAEAAASSASLLASGTTTAEDVKVNQGAIKAANKAATKAKKAKDKKDNKAATAAAAPAQDGAPAAEAASEEKAKRTRAPGKRCEAALQILRAQRAARGDLMFTKKPIVQIITDTRNRLSEAYTYDKKVFTANGQQTTKQAVRYRDRVSRNAILLLRALMETVAKEVFGRARDLRARGSPADLLEIAYQLPIVRRFGIVDPNVLDEETSKSWYNLQLRRRDTKERAAVAAKKRERELRAAAKKQEKEAKAASGTQSVRGGVRKSA